MARSRNPKSFTLPPVRVTKALYDAVQHRCDSSNPPMNQAEFIRRVLIQFLAVRPDAGR